MLPFDFDIFPPPGSGSNELGLCGAPHWVSIWFCSFSLFALSPPLFLSHVSHPLPFSLYFFTVPLTGVEEEVCVKKTKVSIDTSGLVPYGGDSSDEEDERTHSSKTENL